MNNQSPSYALIFKMILWHVPSSPKSWHEGICGSDGIVPLILNLSIKGKEGEGRGEWSALCFIP